MNIRRDRTATTVRQTLAVTAVLVAVAALAPLASAQATRTWISGVGDDANPCSRTAPCKTLAGAISKTALGGEIDALDPGPFGPVTITKAMTIDFTPNWGGVTATTNGITINANVADDVTLRGISISSGLGGTPACPVAGVNGIVINSARSVRIENSRIGSFSGAGILIAPSTGAAQVVVENTDIRDVCGTGIDAEPTSGQTVSLLVRGSTITNSGTGILAGTGTTSWLTGSTIFGNTTGISTTGTGVINMYASSQITGNSTNGTPTTTLGAPIDGAKGANGAAGANATQTAQLLFTPVTTRVKRRSGQKITIGFLSTAVADTTLVVKRAGKRVAGATATSHAGRNTITWDGRIGTKAAKPGTYVLELNGTGARGAATHTQVTVSLLAGAR
jgi:hypothetical protein